MKTLAVPPAEHPLPAEQSIPGPAPLLDFYTRSERELRPHAPHEDREVTWWASSLGMCLQAQYRKGRGEPETRVIDEKTRRAFAWGDQIERFLVGVYYRLGLVRARQVYLYDPALRTSGKVDVVLGWPPTEPSDIPPEVSEGWSDEWMGFLGDLCGGLMTEYPDMPEQTVGVEIKSAHSYAMERMYREGARPAHLIQVGTYWALHEHARENALETGTTEGSVIDRWRLDYIGKDSVGALSFGVTSAHRDVALQRIAVLNANWNADLPTEQVPCSCAGWEVEYCAYSVAVEDSSRGYLAWTCCGGSAKHRRKRKKAEAG